MASNISHKQSYHKLYSKRYYAINGNSTAVLKLSKKLNQPSQRGPEQWSAVDVIYGFECNGFPSICRAGRNVSTAIIHRLKPTENQRPGECIMIWTPFNRTIFESLYDGTRHSEVDITRKLGPSAPVGPAQINFLCRFSMHCPHCSARLFVRCSTCFSFPGNPI